MKILLATNNKEKIERFKKFINHIDSSFEVFPPLELGIEVIDIEENGKTLMENALLKAQAYLGKIDMPILSNDTGFYVEGEGFFDAPKRKALEGVDKNKLSESEISNQILNYWKDIAKKHGGKVGAAWVESFILLYPSGKSKQVESRREIILTDQEFGEAHLDMPVRALYYCKLTGKPAVLHTKEDEIIEMKPVIDAIRKLIKD